MEDKLYKKDQEIEKLKRKIKEIEQKYKKDEKEGSDKKSREIKRKGEEIKDLKKLLKEEEEKRRNAEIITEEKTSENTIYKGQIEDSKAQIQQLEDNELKLRADLGTNKAKIIGLEGKITKLEANYLEVQNQTNEQQQEISNFGNVKAELETEIRLQNEEIEQKNSEIAKFNERIQGLQNQIGEIKTNFMNQIKENEAQFNESLNNSKIQFNNEVNEQKSKFEQYEDATSKEISELKGKIRIQVDELNKNQSSIRELEATKEKLERELKQKDEKIVEVDDTVEKMAQELLERNMKLNSFEESLAKAESGIIDNMPNLLKGQDQAIDKLSQVVKRVKHNAILMFPSIEFLPKIINLSDVKSTMKFRIITNIDPKDSNHRDIFKQYYKANISIRNFEEKTYWGISRDREELVFALNDRSGVPYGFKVEDPFQIEQLGNTFVAIWGKLRQDFHL